MRISWRVTRGDNPNPVTTISSPAPFEPARRYDVETPEQVVVGYELAGLGSRALAAVIDHLILTAASIVFALLIAFLGLLDLGLGSAGFLVLSLLYFGLLYGYFVFFEALRAGQTPGKRLIGIRVVDASGRGVGIGAAMLRNLLRLADILPGPYLVGIITVALHPRNQRLGDLVADTLVVRDRPVERTTPAAEDDEPAALGLTAIALDEESYALLTRVAARVGTLEESARTRLFAQLGARFAEQLDGRGTVAAQLHRLLDRERAARRAGLGGRRQAAGAERFERAKAGRWATFEQEAQDAARRGLDELPPDELMDFAARYRETAADLARARTYGASPEVLHRLERLVASGHATLYREPAHAGSRLRTFIFEACPRAMLANWRSIGVAIFVFVAPLAGGYALLRERPALAASLVSQTMIERADAADARRARGDHYVTTDASDRPSIALSIITNNVRVALTCFAGGIFAGIGALLMLFYNGLMLGTSAGYFANVGQLDYLVEFVVGHGPLELFAICVAGAAGFKLGAAVIAPGNRTRRDALALAGQDALRLVTVTVLILVVAGLIEGLVSTSATSWPMRLAASTAGVSLLLLYLANGLRATPPGASSASEWPAPQSP